MILRLLYIAIKVYIKVSKYLDETASVVRCFIQKAREGFLIKKNPTFFSNDFANGKIDTIMGLATLSQHKRKGGFSLNKIFQERWCAWAERTRT